MSFFSRVYKVWLKEKEPFWGSMNFSGCRAFQGKLLALIMLFSHPLFSEPLKIPVAADSAILMNADTGAVLFQKQAHTLQYPASITKIATALYALDKGEALLDQMIVANQDSIATISEEEKQRLNYKTPAYWLVTGGSHIGIKKGEELPLRALLYGMMIASGNDAANVIAQHFGGTIPNFMHNLNDYLKSIGCTNTRFYNPSGLHHPNHQTTAHDMAILTQKALKNPTFGSIVSTVKYMRPKTNMQEATMLIQTNKLLKSGTHYYAKAIGVKTGYTSHALNTLVAAARHEGRTLIAVLLHVKERTDAFQDATHLFEAAFKQPKIRKTLFKSGVQKFVLKVSGAAKPVHTYLKENVTLTYYPAEEFPIKALLFWDPVSFPIEKDQRVGELRITHPNGVVLKTIPLFAKEGVNQGIFSTLQKAFMSSSKWLVLFKLTVVLALLYLAIKAARKVRRQS